MSNTTTYTLPPDHTLPFPECLFIRRNPDFPYQGKAYANTSYADRHNRALYVPSTSESTILRLFRTIHELSLLEQDYYLRDEILRPLCRAASALLNFDTARLDAGTLSAFLYAIDPEED